MRHTLSTFVAALALVYAVPAFAGIVDSPLPASFTNHVYSVSGVINSGGLSTLFSCTNGDAVSATVGIEVFGPAGGAPLNNG